MSTEKWSNEKGSNAAVLMRFRRDACDLRGLKGEQRFASRGPGQTVGSLGTCSVGAPVIAHGERIYRQCFIKGVQPHTLKAIAENKQIIAIDGDYTYEDGFGNPHKIPMCFRYLSKVANTPISQTTGDNRLEECDSFTIMRNAMLKKK